MIMCEFMWSLDANNWFDLQTCAHTYVMIGASYCGVPSKSVRMSVVRQPDSVHERFYATIALYVCQWHHHHHHHHEVVKAKRCDANLCDGMLHLSTRNKCMRIHQTVAGVFAEPTQYT